MKVMLCLPAFHYKNHYPAFLSLSDFPTGFAYIASALKEAGHEVIGVNPNNIVGYASAYHMVRDTIIQAIKKSQPDLIGIGGLCIDYAFLKDALGVIREVAPKVPVVMGGGIICNDAEFIMDDLKPDFCITGEAEDAIVQLVAILNDGKKNFEAIDNLGYCKEGKVVFTKANYNSRPLDELPFPDYEPFGVKDMMDNYGMATRLLYRYSRPYPRVMGIVTARSCPFTCSFCVHGHRATPYRARSIENIMEEIKQHYDTYQFNVLLILDELFAVNKKRMRGFCEAIIEGKKNNGWDFDWAFQTHASAALDKETLELAKKAGCFSFSYGLESASPIILESMNKKTKPEQIIEAIKLAGEANIGFGGNLIFGDVAETEETIAESLSFWLRYCRESFVFLGSVCPYPGSKLFDEALAKGIIPDKKTYYEHIDNGHINLTSIPDRDMALRLRQIELLETLWLMVRRATDVRYEQEAWPEGSTMAYYSGWIYKVWATCPYCGKESLYRQAIGDPTRPLFIGTGCVACNKKIRIDLPVMVKEKIGQSS